MSLKNYQKALLTTLLILPVIISLTFWGFEAVSQIGPKEKLVNHLPDISGLQWIEKNLFIAVHDTKKTQSLTQPRISLIELPNSERGLVWQPMTLNWSDRFAISNDLEGVARIPDQPLFIIAESGDSFTETFPRLLLLEYQEKNFKIIDQIQWPVLVTNIEGIAILKIEKQLILIFAERRNETANTELQWTSLTLNPLKLGPIQTMSYVTPFSVEINTRQVSAIEVDSQGKIYVASTVDPGNNGPFHSAVWQVGKITQGKNNNIEIILEQPPKQIGVIDGFKVEGLAIREIEPNRVEIFIGTDDENYGGVVRPL